MGVLAGWIGFSSGVFCGFNGGLFLENSTAFAALVKDARSENLLEAFLGSRGGVVTDFRLGVEGGSKGNVVWGDSCLVGEAGVCVEEEDCCGRRKGVGGSVVVARNAVVGVVFVAFVVVVEVGKVVTMGVKEETNALDVVPFVVAVV